MPYNILYAIFKILFKKIKYFNMYIKVHINMYLLVIFLERNSIE